jgi:hypothetical protein
MTPDELLFLGVCVTLGGLTGAAWATAFALGVAA